MEDEELPKIEHYKKFGFSCTIVWEYAVYQEEILDKIFGIGVK